MTSRPISHPCALTIGNFDGIHEGHQAILERTVERARALDLQSAAMIFDPQSDANCPP